MRMTIESTDKIVVLMGPNGVVPARIWEGHTESGIAVHCYITRVAVGVGEDATQFDRELLAARTPSPEVAAIPSRLVL